MIIENNRGEKMVVVMLGEKLDKIRDQMFLVTYSNNSGNLKRTSKVLGVCYKTAQSWKRKLKLGSYGEPSETT